jgi:hypothetical protein
LAPRFQTFEKYEAHLGDEMGNHEFCTGCGASDFHTGQSCKEAYPERWAEKEKQRKAAQAIVDKENARVKKITDPIIKKGKASIVKGLKNYDHKIQASHEYLRRLREDLERLEREQAALRKHCPHPKKYIYNGFLFASCNLCGETDI